jgi:hypothetical protein
MSEQQQADYKAQDMKLSPLDRAVAGLESAMMMGSMMFEAVQQAPKLLQGEDAYATAIGNRAYQPRMNPEKSYEYLGDVVDMLDKAQTEYKLPPILPEVAGFAPLMQAANRQVKQGVNQSATNAGMALERSLDKPVTNIMNRGGFGAQMLGSFDTQPAQVIKNKGGNWLGGNLAGGVDKRLKSLQTDTVAGKTPAERIPMHERLLLDPLLNDEGRVTVQRHLDVTRGEAALDKWIESNVGNYVKKEMGTPEDPVRLMLEKRAQEIEAQYQVDMNRARRTLAKAEAETDPDKRANLMRRADQQGIDAKADKDFANEYATHLPPEEQGWGDLNDEALNDLKQKRIDAGFDPQGMAQSEPAQRWERTSDEAINVTRASDIQKQKQTHADFQKIDQAYQKAWADIETEYLERMKEQFGGALTDAQIEKYASLQPIDDKAELIGKKEQFQNLRDQFFQKRNQVSSGLMEMGEENPFVSKLDPETKLYSGYLGDLGIDHVVDVIKQDVAAGRIRPDQLNKLSMDQAIRRTADYNRELAQKMNSEKAALREGLPVYKEYPEGYRWIELNKPGSFNAESEAMGHSVKGYEPPKGHPDWVEGSGDYGSLGYGYGGWEGIKSGRAKVYSLVNQKGEPHVTVEVTKPQVRTEPEEMQKIYDQAVQEANERNLNTHAEFNGFYYDRVKELQDNLINRKQANASNVITQIKGKGNAAPNEDYLPFVQDFVRSGEWSDVGDLRNTGLHRLGSEYFTLPEAEAKYKPQIQGALDFLETHPSLEEHRLAAQAYQQYQGDFQSPEYKALEQSAGRSIAPNTPYTYRELKGLLTSPEDWTDRNETIYTPISRALDKISEARKELGIIDEPPIEGMKAGGKVHVSDNPDTMMTEMEDQHFGVGGAAIKRVLGIADHAERAAQAQRLLVKMATSGQVDADAQRALLKAQSGARSLPTVLPRAKPKSKEQIRGYAQSTADQLNAAQKGEFLRSDPTGASVNAAGKSRKQWEMEQGLTHDLRSLGLPLDPIKTANIEDQLGMLKMGISGDTSVSDLMLHRAGQYALPSPSEQQGGSFFGLRRRKDPAAWASNIPVLENVQKDVSEFSKAYGDVPVIGQYNSMGPQGTNFAQHFADANLEAIDISKMTPEQIDKANNLIKMGNAKSGAFPDFPGIQDPAGSYFFFSFYPELRKHFNDIMTKPDYTSQLGLPDGRVILHAITDPELRDMPVLTSGRAQYQLVPDQDPKKLPLSEHSTYTHNLPREPDAPVTQTPFPIPAEFEFSDVTEYATPRYKPQEMTRVLQTAAPRQIVDQQHIDEIKQYEDFMRQYTPQSERKKDGGLIKVKRKAGGGIMKKAIKAAVAPATKRLEMSFKDVAKPVPELTEAAQKLKAGKLSREEYEALVNKHKPVTPYSFVPQPATAEDATRALNSAKREKFGKTKEIPVGTPTGLRLDIPAYKDHGVWVNSVHADDMPTMYDNVSSVTNAEMVMPEDKALSVATREANKSPFAVIKGGWNPMSEEEAVARATEYLNHPDWVQVGIDPERHGYYYNRATMEPIVKAEEVIQIGPLVLAKNPTTAPKEAFKYARGGAITGDDLILTERRL